MLLILVVSVCAQAQNTKGDKPSGSRESRFKTPFKKRTTRNRDARVKRVRPTGQSIASRARAGSPRRRASGVDRPGKPIRPLAGTSPKTAQKAWRGDIAGYKIRSRSAGSSRKNVYPQYGRYSRASYPKPTENATSNRSTLSRLNRLQGQGTPASISRQRVIPRSASAPFTARKSINVYANFARPKRKGERASTSDLAGRPLKKKNFETPRPGVVSPAVKRSPVGGDKVYSGRKGGYTSATRQGQRAWTGDIAGRRIGRRNFMSKRAAEGKPIMAQRYRSGTGPHPGDVPLPPRVPGIGASGISRFQGNVRARRPFKGGGSVSGRVWNNDGQPPEGTPPKQGARAALFHGNVKAQRPVKGGGSVSGQLWNNDGEPLAPKVPWQGGKAARYQGNIRVGRPERAMASAKGSLPRKGLSAGAKKVSGYPGRMKRFEVQPGFTDMGETFTGYVKLKKFRKNYVQHPDAAEESIKKKRVKGSAFKAEGMIVKVKRPDYIRNNNAAESALLKVKPSSSTYEAGELQVRVKQKEYTRRPHAVEGSMPGIAPSKSSVKANEYARSVKRNWDYIHNPSASEEALKTREPGKAFARVSAYQGNIKMQKYSFFEKNRALHPDTKFIKTNKNNVDEERDMLTNLKLWWARLFKKEETQPENLKYKGKKPRYDKGEQGLWYE